MTRELVSIGSDQSAAGYPCWKASGLGTSSLSSLTSDIDLISTPAMLTASQRLGAPRMRSMRSLRPTGEDSDCLSSSGALWWYVS